MWVVWVPLILLKLISAQYDPGHSFCPLPHLRDSQYRTWMLCCWSGYEPGTLHNSKFSKRSKKWRVRQGGKKICQCCISVARIWKCYIFSNMSSLLCCFCGKLSSHMFCHSGWIDIWHLVILNIWKQIYFCVQICSHSQGASGDWEACSAYCNQVVNISCFCAAAISGILKLKLC